MNILTLNEDLKASFCLQLLIRVELHKMVIPVGPEANDFAFIEMGSYIFTCPERRIIRQPVTKKNLFYFKVYKYKSNLYRCKYIYLKKKNKGKDEERSQLVARSCVSSRRTPCKFSNPPAMLALSFR